MGIEFKLPELGENIETIQVVNVMVAVGDNVIAEQPVLELETDKATIEVPCTESGVVARIHVAVGDEIAPGQTVLTFEDKATGAEPAAEAAATTDEAPTPATDTSSPEPPAPPPDTPAEKQDAPAANGTDDKPEEQEQAETVQDISARHVAAAPSVRRLAREIGIRIGEVPGSGHHGRVSVEDVKAYAKQLNEGAARSHPSPNASGADEALPDFSQWGAVQRDSMSVIRRKTAEHLTLSWTRIPHVTIHDVADITQLDVLRKRYADRAEAEGGKLTMAVMVVKVAAQALKVFPALNASVDMAQRQIVYKKYINMGIAVSTERGLVVPVIRDADQKNMVQIAVEISHIAEKARANKIAVDDLQGGTFTVTNLGRVGGRFFTPIINYPEVAILGMGRTYEAQQPDGSKQTLLPLSLSFDHRIIDGADGAQFLGWIIEAIQEPLLLALEG